MTDFDIYLLIALAVLVAYLLWSFNRRLNAEIAKAESRYREWQGHGFEAASVSPKIERLRRDYVGAVRSRRPASCSHMERVARARFAVRDLSFFRRICNVATTAQQADDKSAFGPTYS